MFYDCRKNDHGLPHDPFKALVAPRPIGWISSRSAGGVANLAPYSFFNAISSRPNLVMFTSHGRKDSLANIAQTGEFACSVVTLDLAEPMNASAEPVGPEVNEFDLVGVSEAPCQMINVPRVAESPAALECRLVDIIPLGRYEGIECSYEMVIGEVLGIHIADRFIVEGLVDSASMKLLGRLGYFDYAPVESMISLFRPEAYT